MLQLWFKSISFLNTLGMFIIIWLAYVSLPMVWQRVNMMVNTPFLAGFISFIVLYFVILKKWNNFEFIQVHDHERIHALVGMLLGKRIDEFKFERNNGGFVRFKPYIFGNSLISYAPYVIRIPLLLTTVVVTWILSKDASNSLAYYLLGFVFSYSFLVIFLIELRPRQTDLHHTNILHAYICIISAHILQLGVISSLVLPNVNAWFFIQTVIKKALYLTG